MGYCNLYSGLCLTGLLFCCRDQELLKQRLVLNDDFSWRLGVSPPNERGKSNERQDHCKLRYVGGVDLSFAKEASSLACGALVVLDLEIMQIIYEDFEVVHLTMPYLAGFLAFREVLSLSTSINYLLSSLCMTLLVKSTFIEIGSDEKC